MEKVNKVFNGVFALGIILFFTITVLCLCLRGLCPDWLVPNVVFWAGAEILVSVWIFIYIKKGARKILRFTKDLDVLKGLFEKIRNLSFFGFLFGVVQICEAIGIFMVPSYDTKWLYVYGFNIICIASFFFLWMLFLIRDIKRRQEF